MRDDEEGSRLHFLAGWGGKERQSQVLSTLEQLGFELQESTHRWVCSIVNTTVLSNPQLFEFIDAVPQADME